MKKNIVITGSNGFIASHLTKALADKDYNILCLSRDVISKTKCSGNIEFADVDICDSKLVKITIENFNPHVIYHLASLSDMAENFNHATQCIKNNTLGTLNLLEAFSVCSNAEVIVYGDSVKVYGNTPIPVDSKSFVHPNSSYSIGKLAGWYFCELYGNNNKFNAISVRPTLVYGANQPFNLIHFIIISILNNKKEISLMGGEQTRSPLYIDDAIDAYIIASEIAQEQHGLVLNIGGKEELKISTIAKSIALLMESDLTILDSTNDIRDNEILSSSVNLIESKEVFDWAPKINLNDGLKKTIEFYLNTQSLVIAES